ncbi:MAG: pyridoxamine 5'-phosphate oxidase [Actinomycetota bacterium]
MTQRSDAIASANVVDPHARLNYHGTGLTDEITGAPYPWLKQWYSDAQHDPRIAEPGAMVVATVDADGHPDARTVLLKGLSPQGLTFFTNTRSAKGHQLARTPYAAAVLLWHPMFRQVRVRGSVTQTDPSIAEEYFAGRPRGSQLATRASRQSQPIGSRAELHARVAAEQDRWPDTDASSDVPAPSTWGGYLIRPDEIELWVGQRSRIHDRVRFDRIGAGDLDDPRSWRTTRLQP